MEIKNDYNLVEIPLPIIYQITLKRLEDNFSKLSLEYSNFPHEIKKECGDTFISFKSYFEGRFISETRAEFYELPEGTGIKLSLISPD
jgi:hypothetical protein